MPILAGIILFLILIWTPQWVWWTAGGLVVAVIGYWIFLKWHEHAQAERKRKTAELAAEEARNPWQLERPSAIG